jgi:L-arabinose isomerase
MNRKPRAGLLPLYLKLYDECLPDARKGFEEFIPKVEQALASRGVDVVSAGICCIAAEFDHAVQNFEREDVDIIVTIHLAYSASLESIGALTRTKLPIVILDTTMDFDFGLEVAPDRIMYNHGIHGVMDMASMLRRREKPFEIVAGHISESDAVPRAAEIVKAAYAARRLGQTRALRIGESFKGMGDFAVDEKVLRDVLGIKVSQSGPADLAHWVEKVTPDEVDEELAADRERFDCRAPDDVHRRSIRLGLGLRRMLEDGGYDAFSVNFLAFDQPDDTVPFLEISKAMSRGIGYGGEGDVLTASLVGALARAFGDTTFTEIFCPDWKGDSIFLSHMGEVNPGIAAEKPRIVEKPFDFTPAQNPAAITCAPRPGPAVFVNLTPGPDNTFSLIVAPVEILPDSTNEEMKDVVRGWMRPSCTVEDFLELYSLCGGTHHSALVLGDKTEAIRAFAGFAQLECSII